MEHTLNIRRKGEREREGGGGAYPEDILTGASFW